jgi:capsular polysaccharide biosynthesis protein
MWTDYVRLIVRRWWLVLLPALVVGAFTLLSYRPPAITYQTTLRFAAGLPPERTPGVYNYDRQYAWLSSEYLANGLSDIMRTGLFAQNVANRLNTNGLNIAAGQIQAALVTDQKQSIVQATLTWPDATQCRQIGEAVVTELVEHGVSYWPQLSAANSAPVVALDQPAPAPISASLRDRFDLPVRVLLALVVGLALALGTYALDPVVHERRDLERLGMNVIGEIPMMR